MRYILIIGLFLSSCSTPKKLNKLMNKLPIATAKECAERYPIKETIDTVTVTDTALIKAYENEMFLLWKQLDSVLLIGCDTLYIERIKEIIKTKPAKVETKYIIKTQENTAKLQRLKDSLNGIIVVQNSNISENEKQIVSLKSDVERHKYEKRKWFWLFVLMTIYAFRRQILKLIL